MELNWAFAPSRHLASLLLHGMDVENSCFATPCFTPNMAMELQLAYMAKGSAWQRPAHEGRGGEGK